MQDQISEESPIQNNHPPITSHFSPEYTKYLVRGEITRLTNLPKENLYYYIKCSQWDQILSKFQLQTVRSTSYYSENSSVSQSAKGKRRSREHGIAAGLAWPFEVCFKEVNEETAKITEKERREWVEMEKQRLEMEKKEFEQLENPGIKSQKGRDKIDQIKSANEQNYQTLPAKDQDPHKDQITEPDSLSAELSDSEQPRALPDLFKKSLKINDQRVALLFEIFSVDSNSVTNSVGYGIYHIDPSPGTKSVKIPVFMPTMSFWQKLSAKLTGALIEIPDKRKFVSEFYSDEVSKFLKKVNLNGYVHLEFSVLKFDYLLHKKTGYLQTDIGLKEAFVRQKLGRNI